MHSLKLKLVVSALAALLLGACGSGGNDAPAGAADEPAPGAAATSPGDDAAEPPADIVACDLITEEELSDIVGRPMVVGEHSGDLDCAWSADDNEVPVLVVSMTVTPDGEHHFNQNKTTFADVKPVRGVGDDAYRSTMFFDFIKDGIWVNMIAPREHDVAIAKAIAANI